MKFINSRNFQTYRYIHRYIHIDQNMLHLPRKVQTFPSTSVLGRTRSSVKANRPKTMSSTEDRNKKNKTEKVEQVIEYHNTTKHSFVNYAKGPRNLDWANQPNPFRRYMKSPLIPLTHSDALFNSPSYHSLFLSLQPPSPLSLSTISQLLRDSLALSAWKTTGFSTWSLRVNPSSGNLHPTEAYFIVPEVKGLCPSGFVGHYAPKEHALEVRAQIPSGFWSLLPQGSFLIGFSSVFWREAWKYGERAFRYCNHDVGHAIGAVVIGAASLGWDVKVLDGLGDEDLERLMGLEGGMPEVEFEHPDCALLVFPSGAAEFQVDYDALRDAIMEFPGLEWKGEPNQLSKEHVYWDVIYRTAEAVKKPLTVGSGSEFRIDPFMSSGVCCEEAYKDFSASEVVRKRRSAVDMDGQTEISRETFYQILLHCLPSGCISGEKQKRQLALPFRALSWDAEVHAALFVHRVTGLPKGLYFMVRNEEHFDELKKSMRSDFEWMKPDGCPDGLPLYILARGDCQRLSKQLSCHQDIAGDGCFSLGMLARFEQTLRDKGVWMYPRLFWETGVLGQVLYLEAHAIGISATGIGCFFDDPVHKVLGLSGSEFQSLYHFTVGGPVVDNRIMSLPAYPGPS